MKPLLIENLIKSKFLDFCEDGFDNWFDSIDAETPWTNVGAPRDECFMAAPKFKPLGFNKSEWPLKYSYRKKQYYKSIEMTFDVLRIMNYLNMETDSSYDICFLNKYKDETHHLGWHADDSPEMDGSHPIASISFGAPREIW